MNMKAARASRKRSHNDLEDADECLPISKRINSLHIEVQSQGLSPQDVMDSNVSPSFAGFYASAAASNTSSNSLQPHPSMLQPCAAHRVDLAEEFSGPTRLPTINELDNPAEYEINQRHTPGAASSHFARSMSDPYPMYSAHSLSYDPSSSNLIPSQEQMMFTPATSTQQHSQGQMVHHSASDQYFQQVQFPSSSPPFSESMLSPQRVPAASELTVESAHSHSQSLSPFQNYSHMQSSLFHNSQNGQLSPLQTHLLTHSVNAHSEHQQGSSFHNSSPGDLQQQNMSQYSQDFHIQQLPSGSYEPELGLDENPYYYSVNQMLYEAHLSRVRRGSSFPNNS